MTAPLVEGTAAERPVSPEAPTVSTAADSQRRMGHGQFGIKRKRLLQTCFGVLRVVCVQQQVAEISLGFPLAERRCGHFLVEFQLSLEGSDLHLEGMTFDVLLELFLQGIKVSLKSLLHCFLNRRVVSRQLQELAQLRQALPTVPQNQIMNEGP